MEKIYDTLTKVVSITNEDIKLKVYMATCLSDEQFTSVKGLISISILQDYHTMKFSYENEEGETEQVEISWGIKSPYSKANLPMARKFALLKRDCLKAIQNIGFYIDTPVLDLPYKVNSSKTGLNSYSVYPKYQNVTTVLNPVTFNGDSKGKIRSSVHKDIFIKNLESGEYWLPLVDKQFEASVKGDVENTKLFKESLEPEETEGQRIMRELIEQALNYINR